MGQEMDQFAHLGPYKIQTQIRFLNFSGFCMSDILIPSVQPNCFRKGRKETMPKGAQGSKSQPFSLLHSQR